MELERNLKDMQDEKFNWFGAGKKPISSADISISVAKYAEKKDSFNFIFRNKVWEQIGDYIEISAYKNRLFFRKCSTKDNGIKLNAKEGTQNFQNHYARIVEREENKRLRDFVGDFELKYDKFYELYYIEREEEI